MSQIFPDEFSAGATQARRATERAAAREARRERRRARALAAHKGWPVWAQLAGAAAVLVGVYLATNLPTLLITGGAGLLSVGMLRENGRI